MGKKMTEPVAFSESMEDVAPFVKVGVFVRNAYNYDRDAVSVETGLACSDEHRTKQEFKDETDINTLLRKFSVTGELPSGVRMPTYGDFSEVTDFHGAVNAIALARESFDSMPAEVRARFKNDPAEFVAFCQDQKNMAEARKLGLVPPEEVVEKPPAKGGPAVPPTPGEDPVL